MDIKKLNPWNWFKHEEANTSKTETLPAKQGDYLAAAPSNDMLQLHRDINRLFDDMFRGFPSLAHSPLMNRLWNDDFAAMFRANLNVASDKHYYTITLEAPGMDEKDLEIELKERTLFIRGTKQQNNDEKEQSFYRVERRYGSFERVLAIPDDGDVQDIKADMKNGVLTVQIPRKTVAEKPMQRITINKA